VEGDDAGDGFTIHAARERDRRLVEAQKLEAMGRLASSVAHEVNTPLQYIGSHLRFLRSACSRLGCATTSALEGEALVARMLVALDECAEGVESAQTMVLAMRQLAHGQAVVMGPVDLNQVTRKAVTLVQPLAHGICDLSVSLGDRPPIVRGHAGALQHAVLNLLTNAFDAVQERSGERRIMIRTQTDVPDGVIEVEDTGPGIPVELLERVFEPFFTTKIVGKGSGQGLPVTRAIVERHAGSIALTSEPGSGARARIRVPLANA